MLPPPRQVVTFWRSLSPCERRLFQKDVRDLTLQQQADGLNVCLETIRSHRKRILKKWKTAWQLGNVRLTLWRVVQAVVPYLPIDER